MSLFPNSYKIFFEIFAGSAAVTLNKPRSEVEVVNDLNPHIARLHRLMADEARGKLLVERLLRLPHSKTLFVQAKRAYKSNFKNIHDDIVKAELTYVAITQSFNSSLSTYRTGESTFDYKHINWKNLPFVYERMQGVRVKNENALSIIEKSKNNSEIFLFADPPYRQELRGAKKVYDCELNGQTQIKMLKLMADAKCKIMLCGYRSNDGDDVYDSILLPFGWQHYKIADLVKSCQNKTEKDYGEEWVWLNYEPNYDRAKYLISMESETIYDKKTLQGGGNDGR